MVRKKVLVNAYNHLNFGDDLFLKILFERYPHVDFLFFADEKKYRDVFTVKNLSIIHYPKSYYQNKYLNKFLSRFSQKIQLKIIFHEKRKFLEKIEPGIDAVVTIGGSVFMQSKKWHYSKYGIHFLMAKVFNRKPKFIIGANFGPYTNKNFVELFKGIFKQYEDVCFRDQFSKELFSDCKNVRFRPDVVLSLPVKIISKERKSVGFSVISLSSRIDVKHNKVEYYELISRLISKYIQRGYKPYLFSFCEFEHDDEAIAEIINLLSDENKLIVEKVFYNGKIDLFLEKYSKIEKIYTTRFHAMILSLMFQQEFYPFLYSRKMLTVLEDMNCKIFTDIGSNENWDLNYILNNYNKVQSDDSLTLKASEQFLMLDRFLNNPK